MKKFYLNCFVILFLIFISTSVVYASTEENIPPRQTRNLNFSSVDTGVGINSNGRITAVTSVQGYGSVTTSIKISMYLEEYKNGSWVTINTWSDSSTNIKFTLSKTATAKKGTTYRVRSYVTVNGSESVTNYSSSTTY